MKGGRLYKPPKPKNKIPKESKKRKVQHIRYIDQHRKFIQECKDKGIYYCFISLEEFGDSIDDFCTVHHLRGRTGDYYLDKEWWVLAKNKHHLDFHQRPIEWLMKQPYWPGFLIRLEAKDEIAYLKVQNRIIKNAKDLEFSEE